MSRPTITFPELVESLLELLPQDNISMPVATDPKVEALLAAFDPKRDDSWRSFALFDDQVSYTRNLVAAGPDFDLILLCWNPKQGSPIHDHSGCNCWLKVLDGELTERRFAFDERKIDPVMLGSAKCSTGFLAYINDSIGTHQVWNESDRPAVSLHLYCPRHTQCRVYCSESGVAKKKTTSFYSVFGERVQGVAI